MTRACDLIVSGGLFFLLLFTPFAFGSVHPWAYMAIESMIFLLVAVALAKLMYLGRWPAPLGPWIGRLALPLGLFLSLVCSQVVPLPPAVLNFLSPATYRLYQTSLPGWPERPAYIDLFKTTASQPAQARLLPTAEQLRQATGRLSVERRTGSAEVNIPASSTWQVSKLFPWSWRPLSIAPSLTFTGLNKLLAYGGLFFLLLLYPFGEAAAAGSAANRQPAGAQVEGRFLRSLALVLLACASLVALVGIVQRFAGNGKILWLFVPYDWDGPAAGVLQRASGPFVNPDHFANYLALIFPFAIALAVKPRSWFAPSIASAARVYCATSAAIIFMAILLSLSRFGWLSALFSIVLLFFISRLATPSRRMIFFRRRTLVMAGYASAAVLALLILTIWLVGPQARQAIDYRLAETVAGDNTLTTRFSVWRDMLPMIRDFPLLGIGLGTWSDLFPRYQSAGAGEVYFREAHNDFLELLAETGIIGFTLLGLFFFQGGRLVLAGLRAAPDNLRMILAPSLAAIAIMLAHEFFDFSLQIPANALLFTLLLGVAIRLAVKVLAQQPVRDREVKRWQAASGIVLAALLIALTFTQDWLPYPYNLRTPASVVEAAERIDRHPAQAAGHAMIAMLMADRAPLSRQIDAYAIAARLQPNDPRLRDVYASALMREGRREQSLHEIRRSVALAPTLERHFYLNENLLPFLADDERQAIEAGFQQALARGDLPAMDNLAQFYEHTGQPLALAKLIESRAARATGAAEKSEFTLKAGQSYVAAGKINKAEQMFKAAIASRPQDPRPYQALARSVYASQGNPEQIEAIIAQGIANQVDAIPLYLALAEAMKVIGRGDAAGIALANAERIISQTAKRGEDALPRYLALADTARRVGQRERERAALERALELRPHATAILQRVGHHYLETARYDRAALVFTRLVNAQPNSALAFHQLGRAEEGRYGFAAADRAYSRAIKLAPQNHEFVSHRERLKQKLAASSIAPNK